MYECDKCHESSEHSKYHIPVIVDSPSKKKIIIHLECCSTQELQKLLKEKVESEKMCYNDVASLTNNITFENIKKFEEKYGMYDEVKSGLQTDRLVEILAIIDQLKSRNENLSKF